MANYNISVAIATYNGAQFLEEQIESILNQSVKPAEIIVSDDNSTDETLTILNRYQEKGLLKYFQNPGKGVISNFKYAVSNCSKGNFIALSDQDDIWFTDKLEVNLASLLEIQSDHIPTIVFSDLLVVDENNMPIHESFFKDIVNADPTSEKLKSLLFSNKVIGCTIMFNDKMRSYMDIMPGESCMHDYWLALIGFTFGKHLYIPQPLVRYRRHGNNVTASKYSALLKIKKELSDYIFNKQIQLDTHITTVECFYNLYKDNLSAEQSSIIKKFINLKNKSTFSKRMNSFYNTGNI